MLNRGGVPEDGSAGPYLAVDRMQATSIPGVFAASDLASRAMVMVCGKHPLSDGRRDAGVDETCLR